MNHQAVSATQLARALVAFEVLGSLVLNQHLFVVEFSVAVVAEWLHLLLL